MNPGKRLLAAIALTLSFGTSGADDLSQILSMMDQRIAIDCEYRNLLSQLQRTRDPSEQRALEQKITNLGARRDDLYRRLPGNDLEVKARAMPKSDQVRIHQHVNALVERCNATLPPDARILQP